MSLRVVSRRGTATLYIRGAVRGQSLFESAGTADPRLAEGYRAKREAELWQRSVYGPRATVSFSAAVEKYLAAEHRSPATCFYVGRLLEHFRGHPLRAVDQEALDHAYRVILRPGAANATKARGVLTPLRAILEHAAVRGWCDRPAFETPRQTRGRTPVMLPAQATALVQAAAPHLKPLLVFLLGTGARLSEALELDWKNVDLFGARASLDQKQDTERHAVLPPVVVAALSAMTPLAQRSGRVFRPARHNSKRLADSYRDTGRWGGGQIGTAWAGACGRAGLPGVWTEHARKDRPSKLRRFTPEFTPHDCRHTWASWHYAMHRDLLRLREEGGWDTVGSVERYAKRIPDAYIPAITTWLASTPASIAMTA